MNLNRKEKARLLNMAGQQIQIRQSPDEQLAAEAQVAAAVDNPQSSFATTMSVLAHTWFTLDQAREAARMTYIRAVKLREKGREMSTTTVVKQYEEAQVEIEIVEAQLVELLGSIAADPDEGLEPAFGLLASAHTNMQSGISVRLPHGVQVRLALESGILEAEDESQAGDDRSPPPGEAEAREKGL